MGFLDLVLKNQRAIVQKIHKIEEGKETIETLQFLFQGT